jgi:hypothetical protein
MEWQHQYGSRTRRRDEAGSSAINPVWDICWKLIVPAKERIFTWWALHGIIPCMCTLANRHIGGSGQLHVCDWGVEGIAHMMFKCDRALEVWEVLGLTNIIQSAALEDRSGSVVLEHLLRSRQPAIPGLSGLEVKEVIATAAWFIWWRRRELKHNGTAPIPSRLALSIKAMVSNSLRAKKNMSGMIRKGWTKPPSGKVKLNTDAAINLDTRTASTGCIIRDFQGQFLAACRVEIEGVIDVATAEAQAVRDGLRLAERIGCNNIDIETESLEVVNAFHNPFGEHNCWRGFLR